MPDRHDVAEALRRLDAVEADPKPKDDARFAPVVVIHPLAKPKPPRPGWVWDPHAGEWFDPLSGWGPS